MQPAPDGWRFFSADFSMQASSQKNYGNVTYVRNPEQVRRWHDLPDEVKDFPDAPALYIYGQGKTLEEAIADVEKQAKEIPLLEG